MLVLFPSNDQHSVGERRFIRQSAKCCAGTALESREQQSLPHSCKLDEHETRLKPQVEMLSANLSTQAISLLLSYEHITPPG